MKYVDLSLPSGTLWADCNIGAASKEVFGKHLDFDKAQEYAKEHKLTIPTEEEFQELLDNTEHEWTSVEDVEGMLFKGSNGNSIFLPAAGYRFGASFYSVGTYGNYWSSSVYESHPNFARRLYFGSVFTDVLNFSRYFGFTVRAVRRKIEEK